MNKIEVAGLYFSYGRRLVLQGVDFSLRPGVTGLLGQNGSGKTTLLRLLAGDLRPSAGKISFTGGFASQTIGFLPQRFDVLGATTVQRNVEYSAWAHGVDPSLCEKWPTRLWNAWGLAIELVIERVPYLVGCVSG